MKKYLIIILVLFTSCTVAKKVQFTKPLPIVKNVKEVLIWTKANFFYNNEDPLDEAPDIETIFNQNFGDCKMLAGVINVLLNQAGQESIIAAVYDGSWKVFNVYHDTTGWHVIENGKLKQVLFYSFKGVAKYYGFDELDYAFKTYKGFQKWFNKEVYSKKLKNN